LRRKNLDKSIQILGIYRSEANFALQQNHVPIVRQLTIKNCSDSELKDLKVRIATDPDIADNWKTKIDSLIPEQEHILTGINLPLCVQTV